MRRTAALVLSLALVAAGCSGDDDDAAPPTSAPTTTATTTEVDPSSSTSSTSALPVVESLAVTAECSGISTLTGDAEVTWITDGRVLAATPDGSGERCVAEYAGSPSLQWGGDADRLLVGARSVLLGSGPLALVPDDLAAIGWSRPTGKALLARDDEGAVSKLSVDGEPTLDLSVPFTDGEVVYHPAGTAIALVSTLAENDYPPDLLLSNNRGEDVRWLVTNESANAISSLAFTASGTLVFAADHGDVRHIHRLVLGSDVLEHLLETTDEIGPIVASPYDDDLIAAGRGPCRELWLNDESTVGDIASTDAGNGTPIGWLPDGSLVVLVGDDCDDGRGDLYVVAGGEATLLASGVEGAAVRAQLPPPPPPPPEIEAAPA